MKKYLTSNNILQFNLVFFTILGFLFISLKLPQYGLILTLISEIFWLRASYKAWKEAGQFGIFINTIFITVIIIYGVINYWVF